MPTKTSYGSPDQSGHKSGRVSHSMTNAALTSNIEANATQVTVNSLLNRYFRF